MKLKSILFSLAIILPLVPLAFILFFFISAGYFKNVKIINQQNCTKRLDYSTAIQDIQFFHQNYLIGGACDLMQMQQGQKGIQNTPNGELVYIRLDNMTKIQKLQITDFPQGVKLFPHGIFLDKRYDLLYVINHGFKYGGQRVEVFLITQEKDGTLQAKHKSFHKFGLDKTGVFNELIVHNSYLYITQHMPQSQPITGVDTSQTAQYRKLWNLLTGKRGDNVQKCKIQLNLESLTPRIFDCQNIIKGSMIFPNGITSDLKANRIWVSDFMNNKIFQYKIDEKNGDLIEKDQINLNFSVDNMEYLADSDSLLVSTAPRMIQFFNFTKAYDEGKSQGMYVTSGGAQIFFKEGKVKQVKEIFMQRNHSGISSVKKMQTTDNTKAYYFVGSWHHKGAALGLIMTFVSGFILYTLGYFNYIQLLNKENCNRKLKYNLAIQDLQTFHNNYMIGGADDKLELFEGEGIQKAANGHLVYFRLDMDDIQKVLLHQIEMKQFPDDVRFQPHGIFLDKSNDLLYVINHAYTKGGQRVQVFLIQESEGKLIAHYKTSIQFDEDRMGVFNDLIVHNDYVYLTQWLSSPDPKQGRDHSFIATMKRSYRGLTYRGDNVHRCKIISIDQNKTPKFGDCLVNVRGLMKVPNGITVDKKNNRVWVSDSADKKVYQFGVNAENGDLEVKDVIELDFGVDNLEYQEDSDSVLLSTILRVYEYLQFQKAASKKNTEGLYITTGGSELMYENGKFKEVVDLFKQRNHSGISVVKRFRTKDQQKNKMVNFYFMGSWHDNGVGICQIYDEE